MLTTRMSPKMSENPLATMNSQPANVRAFRSVTLKLRGSSIAGPKIVSFAKKRTQRIARPIRPKATKRAAICSGRSRLAAFTTPLSSPAA